MQGSQQHVSLRAGALRAPDLPLDGCGPGQLLLPGHLPAHEDVPLCALPAGRPAGCHDLGSCRVCRQAQGSRAELPGSEHMLNPCMFGLKGTEGIRCCNHGSWPQCTCIRASAQVTGPAFELSAQPATDPHSDRGRCFGVSVPTHKKLHQKPEHLKLCTAQVSVSDVLF